MKAYSIGRDQSCDIVINDNTDVISRRHAILNVSNWGKYTIVDNSTNGTYVNGIRISPNVPVPVTRKDIISFAHVSQFDWGRVPKSNKGLRTLILSLVALLVVACLTFGVLKIQEMNKGTSQEKPVVESDTIKKEKPDTTKTEEPKDRQNPDTTKKNKPAQPQKPSEPKDNNQNPDTTKNKKPEQPRAIG